MNVGIAQCRIITTIMRFTLDILVAIFVVVTGSAGCVQADCSSVEGACSHCASEPTSNPASTYAVGTYLHWRCEENYVMVGTSDVIVWVCGEDNQWSGKQPNCTAVTCPHPPVPAYGEASPVEVDQYSVGDTIAYTCQDGYQLRGSDTNNCGADGSWENEAPTCAISNEWCDPGRLDVMTSSHSCIKADQLLKPDTMRWTDARTTCQNLGGKVSAELAMIKTQTMQDEMRDLINFPKTFDVYFDSYFWIGLKEGRNWKWSSDDSNIQRLFWADGKPSANSGSNCIALSSSEAYHWVDASCGIARRFICQYDGSCTGRDSNGAILLTDHPQKCYRFSTTDATWSEARAECADDGGSLVEVMDQSLEDFLTQQASHLEEALQIVADWWIGGYDDVTATERAWFWVDNTRATFTSWNHNQPSHSVKCVEVNSDMNHNWNDKRCNANLQAMCQIGIAACGDPGAPAHGTRSPGERSTFFHGAAVQFSCDLGYALEGDSEITCQPDGSWDGIKPSCRVLSCDDPVPLVHKAGVRVISRSFRGTAVYTCTEGSVPAGNPISYCQANAMWSQSNFECIEVTSTLPTKELTKTPATTESPETTTVPPAQTTSSVPLTSTTQETSTLSSARPTDSFTQTTTAPSPGYPTSGGKSDPGNVTGTIDTTTNAGTSWQNTSVPLNFERVMTTDIMVPVGALFAVIIIVIIIIICLLLWRKRRRLHKAGTPEVPSFVCIGKAYRISFKKNTIGSGARNNNDVYIGLDLGSMQTLASDTHESRYLTLGQGITGRSRAGTGLSIPRERSDTANSRTELVAVDDEGYASLKIGEVRSTHHLPYTNLTPRMNSDQKKEQNISSGRDGDVGSRKSDELEGVRSTRVINRESIDSTSNQYETLETPRPSIDMGVLGKQESLGEHDYDELDSLCNSFNNGAGTSESQNHTKEKCKNASDMQTDKGGDTQDQVCDDFEKFRSAFEAFQRGSKDTTSNQYATLETPRPSIDMGVLSKQGSLGEHDYDELDSLCNSFNNGTGTSDSQNVITDNGKNACDVQRPVREDPQDQVCGKSEGSNSPKTIAQNASTQEEHSSNSTNDRPTSHGPYYFCLNPSADTTDVTHDIPSAEAHSLHISEELKNEINGSEPSNEVKGGKELPEYQTLEPQ